MPRTVIAPTLRKSFASVSWTSANCAVGPPMWPDAAGPNVAAPSARVTRASLMIWNAPPVYGALDDVR